MTRLLTEHAAAVPLVLVFDDLHCADEPSLRLLRFLARELGAARILVVGTYRDVEASGSQALLDALAELARLHHPKRKILLRGLTQNCVRRFIQRVSGADPSPALVETCYARSEGNPLFLLELLHWMQGREESREALPVGDAGRAIDYCERAGDRALAVLAFDQALRHYERALRVAEAALPLEAARRARLEQAIAAARNRSAGF